MKYRNFKGEHISEIGLGTWQLGGSDWNRGIEKKKAFAILEAFAGAGGNFIDTADVYGSGISEETIGEFLRSTNTRMFVATKLGRRSDGLNGWPQNFSYETIRKHVEDSLKRLGQEQLFLEQLHCIPTEELRRGEVFEHLRKIQQQGLIKYFGVSVETAEEAEICLEHPDIASLQIIFNIFRQHLADVFFEKAQANATALIARVPLASGLLSGKFNNETRFPVADHRNFNANGEMFNVGETFSGLPFETGVTMAQEVKSILKNGKIAPQSIRWILDHPAITTVIPGASSVAQVKSNVSASDLSPLAPEVHQQLRTLYEKEIKARIRGLY